MENQENKAKNYDKTSAKRGRNNTVRINDAGLSNLKVVMLKEHAEKIRAFARELYEAEGYSLDTDDNVKSK